jgi:uroporphyrinogen-III synthase
MPLIEVVDVATPAQIDAAISPLTAHDWVVATSLHAAERITEAVARSRAKVAAVGATTAAALPRADLVPAEQRAAGLVASFPGALPAGRVVVAQARGGAPTLARGLTERGWAVTRLDTHESRPLVPGRAQQLAALRADAVLFTSGSQAKAWRDTFGTATPAIVVAMGPQTARDAEAQGLKVDVVAADHSLSGVVRALRETLQP